MFKRLADIICWRRLVGPQGVYLDDLTIDNQSRLQSVRDQTHPNRDLDEDVFVEHRQVDDAGPRHEIDLELDLARAVGDMIVPSAVAQLGDQHAVNQQPNRHSESKDPLWAFESDVHLVCPPRERTVPKSSYRKSPINERQNEILFG